MKGVTKEEEEDGEEGEGEEWYLQFSNICSCKC